jgi:hypothetical protein
VSCFGVQFIVLVYLNLDLSITDTYLHTTQSKTETIYTKLENCTTIETGCFYMYLAMCRGCNITIQLLNSSRNNITESFTVTLL